MAITATTGSAASTTSAAASLALPQFNLTAAQSVYVAVALDSTASSVTSITDTKGNTYTLSSAVNGTGIRVELWKCASVGVQTNNIITINVSPNCNVAGAAEEYAGLSALGNTGTNSGSSVYPRQEIDTQEASNFAVYALGFGCQSGDTFTAVNGTSRQSSVPAATAAAVALYDNTALGNCTLVGMSRLSSSRAWASAGLELRAGGASTPYEAYDGVLPLMREILIVSALPDLYKVYAGVDRGDGSLGTLHASNISAAVGSGSNLSAAVLQSGVTVDDVTGSLSAGGGALVNGGLIS